MRSIVLVSAVVFSASSCLAQTAAQPQPDEPGIAAQPEGTALVRDSGPANLCQELLAFMTVPAPEAAAAAKPAAPAQQSTSTQQPAGTQDSAAQQGTTGSGDPAKKEGATGSAQEITGQDGVATDAPKPGKDNAASGSATNAPQKESRAAPVPPADVTSTPKESVLTIEAAEQLASANDITQCQKRAREMRVAGVAMPPPLIALAALDVQYQHKPAAEPVGAAAPAESEQTPAPQ